MQKEASLKQWGCLYMAMRETSQKDAKDKYCMVVSDGYSHNDVGVVTEWARQNTGNSVREKTLVCKFDLIDGCRVLFVMQNGKIDDVYTSIYAGRPNGNVLDYADRLIREFYVADQVVDVVPDHIIDMGNPVG